MRTGHRNIALSRPKTGSHTQQSPVRGRASSPSSKNNTAKDRSRIWSMGWAVLLVLLAAAGVVGSGWLALQLMVNPQALSWINQLVPDWIPVPVSGLKPPQTLQEIQTGIRQTGRIPGEPLPLGKNKSFLDGKSTVSDLLIPLLAQQPNATNDSPKIVELRVYQSIPLQSRKPNQTLRFQLVNQLAIVGPQESFAIAPLVNASSTSQGSTRSLPLTSLRFEDKAPAQGVWLNLSGLWNRRDETVAYGQIVHYNPDHLYLGTMLEWSSTTGQPPLWRELTGKGLPELIINQTLGMDPQFKVYQVKPRSFLPDPIQLEPVSLADPALDSPVYSKALLLARNGLWSTGWKWLQSYKQRSGGKGGNWSASAQAQVDLVHLHAQITKTQADQSWASPNQQVLANLMDGRWTRALKVFEDSPENGQETAALLKADSGQIQNRLQAALQVEPGQPDVKTWKALLIAAQRGEAAAIAWVKKQPKTTTADTARISQLIKRLQDNGEQ